MSVALCQRTKSGVTPAQYMRSSAFTITRWCTWGYNNYRKRFTMCFDTRYKGENNVVRPQ